MEQTKLKAELRTKIGGKGGLSAMRGEKNVPCIVYGGKTPPMAVSVHEKELLKIWKGGSNTIITMEFPGGSDTVIVKKLQRHVIRENIIHADFQRISLADKIDVRVHIKLTGESPGVKLNGGLIEHSLRELKVRSIDRFEYFKEKPSY